MEGHYSTGQPGYSRSSGCSYWNPGASVSDLDFADVALALKYECEGKQPGGIRRLSPLCRAMAGELLGQQIRMTSASPWARACRRCQISRWALRQGHGGSSFHRAEFYGAPSKFGESSRPGGWFSALWNPLLASNRSPWVEIEEHTSWSQARTAKGFFGKFRNNSDAD